MITFTVSKRILVRDALSHCYFDPVRDLLTDNNFTMAEGLIMNIVPKKRDVKQKQELCRKVN